jgi:hypothetical protein
MDTQFAVLTSRCQRSSETAVSGCRAAYAMSTFRAISRISHYNTVPMMGTGASASVGALLSLVEHPFGTRGSQVQILPLRPFSRKQILSRQSNAERSQNIADIEHRRSAGIQSQALSHDAAAAMRTRSPLGITSVRGFECTAHAPADLSARGLTLAPGQTVTSRAMSAFVRFRDVGCRRRCHRPRMRAGDRVGWASARRGDHYGSRKGAWQSWRNGGLGRLRYGVVRRWIEGRPWLRRWRLGILLRLCMVDCQAEENHPSGHEIPRQRRPLKSLRLHRGLLRAGESAQSLWIDNTTIDNAVPGRSQDG